jgi:hypothetical protein
MQVAAFKQSDSFSQKAALGFPVGAQSLNEPLSTHDAPEGQSVSSAQKPPIFGGTQM